MTPATAATACPLCGDANGCAPAGCGRLDVPCWCRDATIPAALVERLPEALRGVACLCARCVDGPTPGRDG